MPALAKRVCHRQLGIGADGLIIVRRDPLTMDIINSDGSVAPMCGNGIRCFARHCLETEIVPAGTAAFDVETLAGLMKVRVSFAGGFTAEINMGRPDWSARSAGIDEDGEFIGRTVSVGGAGDTRGESVRLSSLFLGTYHTVVWLDENEWIVDGYFGADGLRDNSQIDRVGRILESHPTFTKRTNVNFVSVIDRHTVEMITWERGAGLTAACGTGASSVVALGIREGRLGSSASAESEADAQGAVEIEVKVMLPYGELFIRQDADGEIYMRGPAEHIFDGAFYE
jgi:diaminopimelate epimerase